MLASFSPSIPHESKDVYIDEHRSRLEAACNRPRKSMPSPPWAIAERRWLATSRWFYDEPVGPVAWRKRATGSPGAGRRSSLPQTGG